MDPSWRVYGSSCRLHSEEWHSRRPRPCREARRLWIEISTMGPFSSSSFHESIFRRCCSGSISGQKPNFCCPNRASIRAEGASHIFSVKQSGCFNASRFHHMRRSQFCPILKQISCPEGQVLPLLILSYGYGQLWPLRGPGGRMDLAERVLHATKALRVAYPCATHQDWGVFSVRLYRFILR